MSLSKPHQYAPTEAEIAYCTGLFEGEGSVFLAFGDRRHEMKLSMTDREPVERFARILGGHVHFQRRARIDWKDQYVWKIMAWRDVVRVCELLRPGLCSRRQAQIDKVLALRPGRMVGAWACPTEVTPSTAGYQQHRLRGEEPCAICAESYRLYWRLDYRAQRPEGTRINRPRLTGCLTEVIPAVTGYRRHKKLGEEPCDICLASFRLYYERQREQNRAISKP